MVLRPLEDSNTESRDARGVPPAWVAIAERQKQSADAYWLVSQPDHANLSGELAANVVAPQFPRIDPLIARAIGVHDSGWAMFDAEADPRREPMMHDSKPLSFIEFSPPEFLRAWTGSIERAESICPAGGVIVSRHFCELGDFRLKNGALGNDDVKLISAFHQRERLRQQRLLEKCTYSPQELRGFLETLQFCDLLSLFLCSGAGGTADFGQRLTDRPVRITRTGNSYRLDPSPFQHEGGQRVLSLGVQARYFPVNGEPRITTLSFLLS